MGGPGSGRKKKSGAAGTEGVSEAWDKAAAEAANDTAKKPAKGGQGRLPLDADTEQIRTERELATPLMPEALLLAAQSMAAAQQTLERLDKELADLKAAQHDDRAAAIKDRTKYAREVSTRSAWLVVPCREVHRFRQRTVEVYRLDQGDPEEGVLVETRAMTPAELERATFEPPAGETIDLDDAGPSAEPVH